MKSKLNVFMLLFLCFLYSSSSFCQTNTKHDKSNSQNKSKTVDDKWNAFFIEFKSAFTAKDKRKIQALTASNFFDGGGGSTINEWVSGIFKNDNDFKNIKKTFNRRVTTQKSNDGIFKYLGSQNTGDLYFVFKANKWLFGGVTGD